jgi:uncharacterized membrane protein YphA (DoxX/SURF4 family)
MKKPKVLFWMLTIVMALSMLAASITDLIPIPEAVEGFKHYGYPTYLLPVLGIARILGIIAIVSPGFPQLKEWAYAGFVFDVVLAIYSGLAVGDPVTTVIPPAVALVFTLGSYTAYHRVLRAQVVARQARLVREAVPGLAFA